MLTRNPFWYIYWLFVYSFLYALALIFLRFRVIHREKAFRRGGVIYAPNHVSFLDPPLTGLASARPLVYMAKRELMKGIPGFIMRSLRAHPVDRDGADLAAYRFALKTLKDGHAMVIFPEGTRSPDGNLLPSQPGIARIARRASVPIVPVHIKGTFESFSRHMKKPKCHPVSIVFGDPISVEEINTYPDDKDGYKSLADEVMRRVALLAQERDKAVNT